ncbi:MAG: hypothetical protein JO152_09460 [Mycobacteriaceae bacterium]|nr:hypothetical protein [Mycobacteriaceae bacterium]
MRRLVRAAAVVGWATVLVLTSCDRHVDGHAAVGARDSDPAYFFAGDVPTFGRSASANDSTALAYLRALRRIDVCGMLGRDTVAKIGELVSVATFFAFNECDADVKVPGDIGRKLVAVELVMADRPGDVVEFRIDDTPVYRDYASDCEYLVPLDLEKLPGAQPLRTPAQPFVRLGLIADSDCATVQRMAAGIAQRLATAPLPPRDGAAVYPARLAERDPCEVLGPLGERVDHWDVDMMQPHLCEFALRGKGSSQPQTVRVQLEPQVVDSVTDGRQRLDRDGVEIYLDRTFCTAVSFLGPAMQRRLIGGGFVDSANVVVRPAVSVEGASDGCDAVTDIAAQAAKLYA